MGRPADPYYDNRDYDYDRGHQGQFDDRRGEQYPRQRHPRDDQYDRQPRHEQRRDPNEGQSPPKKSRKKMWGAISITVRVLILVFMLIFFTMPQFADQRELFVEYLQEGLYHYKNIPDYMIFNIEREMTMETATDTTVSEFTLTVTKPFEFEDENKNVVQELQDIGTLRPEGSTVTENYGEKIITFSGSIGLGGKANMKVYYKIRSAHLVWDLAPSDVGKLSDIPADLKQQYSKNDWRVNDPGTKDPMVNPYNPGLGTDFYRIHPTDPDVNELAFKLKGTETNVLRILMDFYDFMDRGDGNSTYSGGSECAYPDQFQMQQTREAWAGLPKPARATMDDWVGDCDDQSFLFISMCRAVGIPARVEAGALWDSGAGAWGGHGWAQVYVPIKDGENAWVTIDMVNNLFLERDPFRFTDYIGDGIPERLENYYTSWTYRSSGGGGISIDETYTDTGHRAIPSETIVHV